MITPLSGMNTIYCRTDLAYTATSQNHLTYSMLRQRQQIFLHIIGCIVFLSLPLLFSPESLSLRSYLTNPPTQRDIIAYTLVLAAFYINFYLLIPRLYFRRHYPTYILTNLLLFLLIAFVPYLHRHQPPPPQDQFITPRPGPHGPHHPPSVFWDISQHLSLFLLILFFALLIKVRDRLKKTEAEKLHSELAYLKTQINPHFLFNTLNSIYSMALERSDRTADAIVRLSSMMRYVLLDTGREKVPLDQELNYLTDYIQLQQTRFEGSSHIHFSVEGAPIGHTIVPLLLIPFIENSFKHGINPEEPSDIYINIKIHDDQLSLQTTNKKLSLSPQIPHSGLGIQNTRQRLQHLYPGKFTLHIEDGPKDFAVFLTLKLT